MKKIVIMVAVAAVAGVASAAIIPINDAIDQFEYLDLANTTPIVGGELVGSGDAWSVEADVDTAAKPRAYGTGGTTGNLPDDFRINFNPKNAGDLIRVKSATIGTSLISGQEYKFSVDLGKGGIGGNPEWVFEVWTADNVMLSSSTNFNPVSSSFTNVSHTFTASAADAGKDVYFKVIRDSTIGTMVPKGGYIDNIVLETIPEPGTLSLVGAFGAAMLIIRRRMH